MKTLLNVSFVFLCVIFFACGSKEQQTADAETAAVDEEESTDKPAVCIWKEVSIKETAGEKGKYKTSIFLGEKIKALPDTASEVTGNKRVFYRKVRLTDGAEGWVRADFIAVDAVPAAFIKEATLYKRPDIMTTSGKNFFVIDFVAIKSTAEGGWAEVIGKRAGDTWFSSGWVKSENLTTTDVDVAFSSLYMRAKEISDPTKQEEAIATLLGNSELSSSVFQSEFANDGEYEEETVEDYVEDESADDSESESENDNEGDH